MLSGFIVNKVSRKNFRAKYSLHVKNCTNSPFVKNAVYGKIYLPIYSKSSPIIGEEYTFYNSRGEELIPFFYRGYAGSMLHSPLKGNYLYFDRFNCGLKNHLYMDGSMLEVIGSPDKKYGMFSEPKTIYPDPYEMVRQNKGLNSDFDLIFTHSENVLDLWDNARPFCYFASVWHILQDENGFLPANWYENKTKDISIVSSDKKMCNLHKFRIELAKKCQKEALADAFGTFQGAESLRTWASPDVYLDNYCYSIIIENDIDAYWFTEKILNCFATMTIPVYLGATKIGEYFNEDGIIRISEKDFDNIDRVLKQCTKEEYDARLDILKENYEKSKQFLVKPADRLYERYLRADLNK